MAYFESSRRWRRECGYGNGGDWRASTNGTAIAATPKTHKAFFFKERFAVAYLVLRKRRK